MSKNNLSQSHETQSMNRKDSSISNGSEVMSKKSSSQTRQLNHGNNVHRQKQKKNDEINEDHESDFFNSSIAIEDLNAEKKKKVLSLQEIQSRRLGEETFIQRKYKLEILLEGLKLNQSECFPYQTRYTPMKRSIFEQMEPKDSQEKEIAQKKSLQAQALIEQEKYQQNTPKEAKQLKRAERPLSFAQSVKKLEAIGRKFQTAIANHTKDEFLDQIW